MFIRRLEPAASRPLPPPGHRASKTLGVIWNEMRRSVRGVIRECERNALTRPDREGGAGRHILAPKRNGGVQLDRIGASHGTEAVVASPHPRNGLPVVEADAELHQQGHLSFDAFYHPHEIDFLLILGER